MKSPANTLPAILDADDIGHNDSPNATFESVLQARLGRRSMLRSALGTAATAVFGSVPLIACGGGNDDAPAAAAADTPLTKLDFSAVAKNLADSVAVPSGYTASIIYALGDPLTSATAAYKNDGTDTGFETRAGDHHDGMEFFGLSSSGTPSTSANDRGLLAVNHEATTDETLSSMFLHANGGTTTLPRPASEVDKEVPIHGVSIVEVKKTGSSWATQQSSTFNRRITPLTDVAIAGPARGNALLKTKYSPTGVATRGTLNNCGTGKTPWGSFVTGEENWAGYFTRASTDDAVRTAAGNAKSVTSLNRYGRAQGGASRHGWETAGSADQYARWIISQTGTSTDGSDDYRNELNGMGYVVEIDPYSPSSTVYKRTALGRFAHESAAFSNPVVGKPLAVYMGDDSRNEYIYKFVSTATWSASDASPTDRLATGAKFLDTGKLYVAKFNADGTGTWVELNISNTTIASYPTYTFADQADVVVNARLAGDAVGATKMDRPEWCSVHPTTGEVYYTLTNNSNRRLAASSSAQSVVDAANPRSYSDIKGTATTQQGNVNGHILRLKETSGEASATSFTWDVYLFGAEAGSSTGFVNLSNLTSEQDFSSPDGLWFSPNTGICWIQTDDGAYTDVTNCMMLAAIPGTVGDGASKTLTYSSTQSVTTYVGKAPTTSTLKRFLVGPVGSEITGLCETADGKNLFVNIQHPGESTTTANVAAGNTAAFTSHWPGNAGYQATAGNTTSRPRSATIVITKNDGGRIGT